MKIPIIPGTRHEEDVHLGLAHIVSYLAKERMAESSEKDSIFRASAYKAFVEKFAFRSSTENLSGSQRNV